MTASINFLLYRATIPRAAAAALIPVCVGVAITSYYDTKPTAADDDKVATTSSLGVAFALVRPPGSYDFFVLSTPETKRFK